MSCNEYVCVNIKEEPANSDDQLNLKSVVNEGHDINGKEDSAEYIYHDIFVKDENMELESNDEDDEMIETNKDFLATNDNETSENGEFKLNETFYCPLCTYTSTKKAYLKKHSVVHLNDKIFRCPQCHYGCNRKWDFRIHLLTHTKAKLFTCANCDYACNTRRQLNVHKLKHLDTKLFRCCDCEYECNRKWDLNRHLLKHMETKLFRCCECEYACNRKEKLSQHLLTHSSIKLFKCLKCDYSCNQKGNLSRHYLLKHTPKKSYDCSECSFSSTNFKDFRIHISKHVKSYQSFEGSTAADEVSGTSSTV